MSKLYRIAVNSSKRGKGLPFPDSQKGQKLASPFGMRGFDLGTVSILDRSHGGLRIYEGRRIVADEGVQLPTDTIWSLEGTGLAGLDRIRRSGLR